MILLLLLIIITLIMIILNIIIIMTIDSIIVLRKGDVGLPELDEDEPQLSVLQQLVYERLDEEFTRL